MYSLSMKITHFGFLCECLFRWTFIWVWFEQIYILGTAFPCRPPCLERSCPTVNTCLQRLLGFCTRTRWAAHWAKIKIYLPGSALGANDAVTGSQEGRRIHASPSFSLWESQTKSFSVRFGGPWPQEAVATYNESRLGWPIRVTDNCACLTSLRAWQHL